MTYLDAHYARLRLADDLASPTYRRYVEGFFKNKKRYLDGGAVDLSSGPEYLDAMIDVLEKAETFALSHNMYSLVQASATDMPAEPLLPEDLPSREGFLWLAEPITELDVRGRLLRHHAVLWGAVNTSVVVWWFADRGDNMDEVNQSLRRNDPLQTLRYRLGRFMLAEATQIRLDRALPVSPDTTQLHMLRDYGVLPDDWETSYNINYETIIDEDGTKRLRYVPVLREGGDLTEEQFALIEDAYHGIAGTERISDGLKQLVCFWRLCQQTLSAREYEQPSRALRKQMIRRKLVPKAVTVIVLRRRKATGEGQNTVEWDHRWVRRGHWRQQWFGSHEAERYQRAIYINPTICGPEHLPLVIRPHVNLLKR